MRYCCHCRTRLTLVQKWHLLISIIKIPTGSYLDLKLTRASADLSGYTVNGEWDLISTKAERNIVNYSCCPDPYIDVTYTIHTRRRVLFYINNLIFPCMALSVLVTFAFFLPPESGERISLMITILLGFTVYTLIFTENIPPTSQVMPLLTKFSTVVMAELGFSLLVRSLRKLCRWNILQKSSFKGELNAKTNLFLFESIGIVD